MSDQHADIFLPDTTTAGDTAPQPVHDPVYKIWVAVVGGVEVYGRTLAECKANAVQWGSGPKSNGKHRTYMTTLESVGRRL